MTIKAIQKQLIAAVAMLLVAAIALSSATYAWFVNNATVTATGAQVTASTAYSLLISKTKGEDADWKTTDTLAAASTLTPVSTIGTKLADAKTDLLSNGANNGTGTKGDIRFVTSSAWSNNLVINYNEVGKTSKTNNTDKYFYSDTVYLKAGQTSNILLNSATDASGIMWKGWDSTNHMEANTATFKTFEEIAEMATVTDGGADAKDLAAYNAKVALLKTLRIGLQVTNITGKEADETAISTARADGSSKFFVYQLSSSQLTGFTVTTEQGNADGVTSAIGPTASATDTVIASGTTANLNTNDNNTLAFANKVENSGVPLISAKSAEAPTTGMVASNAQTSKDVLATVKANDVVEVDVYIWMEGCDKDVAAATLNQFNAAVLPGIQLGFCLGEPTAAA